MTETLATKTCPPCRGGLPPPTRDEAGAAGPPPPFELRDDAHRLERRFRFSNYREALAFVGEVGALAESEGHHPDVSFGWGYAAVSLQTKKIKGCTRTISSWRARSTVCSIGPIGRQVDGFAVSGQVADSPPPGGLMASMPR